jgi:hypothetical protein
MLFRLSGQAAISLTARRGMERALTLVDGDPTRKSTSLAALRVQRDPRPRY